MEIMEQMRRLEAAGYQGELLDRAIALAGAQRLIYQSLCRAVETGGLSPAEALRAAEAALPPRM